MRRFGSVAAASAKLLPMPKLSPDMEFGTVEKWMIKPGSLIKPYQLVLEISTESALNSSVIYIMEVEITEKLYLSKILVKDGQKVNVGSPIAIFCKDEDQIEIASKLEVSVTAYCLCKIYVLLQIIVFRRR